MLPKLLSAAATENGATTTYAANSLNQYTALNPASTNPTPFTYDADGNMTSDGTWSCTWDAENRLIEVQPLATNLGSSLVQYMYDAQSRRIARREFAWNDYLCETTWHYVQGRACRYDGWNLLQERKPATVPRTPHPYISQTNLALTGIGGPVAAGYIWGLDLSGTLQGAGGIGGLLQATSNGTNAFSFYDANGNTTGTTDGAGNILDSYRYDGFGKECAEQTSNIGSTPFHFSTKIVESAIRLSYFGYRYYASFPGRWTSRDPIATIGFLGVHGGGAYIVHGEQLFVENAPISSWDRLGLWGCCHRRVDCSKGCAQNKQQRLHSGHRPLGEVICYQGEKCLCLYPENAPYDLPETSTAFQCIRHHEETHFNDPNTPYCPPYDCKFPEFIGKPGTAPNEPEPNKAERECYAYTASLECMDSPDVSQSEKDSISWRCYRKQIRKKMEEYKCPNAPFPENEPSDAECGF